MRLDQTDALHFQWPPVKHQTLPTAWTDARGRIQPETFLQRCETAKGARRDVSDGLPNALGCPQPAILSTSFCPKIIGWRRVPCRRVDSVGHISNGYFIDRPAWEERLEKMSADFPMQTAHAIHRAASPNGQIGHVETLRGIVRIQPAMASKS